MVVVVAALAPIAIYIYVAVRRLGYPFELEWLEGGEVEIVNRVVHGQAIYVAPSLHYVPYPYPPLFIWVSAAFAKVLGVGFLAPRLVSFLASLGVLALLWQLVRRETGDTVAGLVAAGLFAATYQASGAYFDLARVDSLFLVLLLAAVAVARRGQTWRAGGLIGVLLFLSFFSKQTALIAALPLLVYLVVFRRRVGIAACLTLGALLVVSTLVLDHASHGWYDYYVFEELPSQGINAHAIESFIPKSLLRPTGWAVVLGLVGLAVGLFARRSGRPAARREHLTQLALLDRRRCSASWGRPGSRSSTPAGSSDVLMPAYAAVAIFAGLGYHELIRTDARYQALLGTVLAVVIVVQVVQLDRGSLHEIPSLQAPRPGTASSHWCRPCRGRSSWPTIPGTTPWQASRRGPSPKPCTTSCDQALLLPDTTSRPASRRPWPRRLVTTVFADDRRRHHRSRIRALLPTRSAGVHLHAVFLPGDRRPTAALSALRPPVTLPDGQGSAMRSSWAK